MVERGRGFEQNGETFEAPQTSGEQPYVTPIEQAPAKQEQLTNTVPQTSSEQSAPETVKIYDIDAVANGTETPGTLDLQTLMNSQFEQANDGDSDKLPDAA